MDILHQIVVLIVTLGVLVAFHEYGHFWVARRCNVKVLRFSIGFGTPLLRWRDKLNTEYVIAALPLGGYVKMLDEREGEVAEHERHLAFNRKSVQQRIAIVSAGPLANLLLAVVVYWFVFLRGVTGIAPIISDVTPDSVAERAGLAPSWEIISVDGDKTATQRAVAMQLIQRIGDTGQIQLVAQQEGSDYQRSFTLNIQRWLSENTDTADVFGSLGLVLYLPVGEPVIEEVISDSAAQEAGLKAGDRLLKVNEEAIKDWRQWVKVIQANANNTLNIVVERDGLTLPLTITPREVTHRGKAIGQVGVKAVPLDVPDHLLRKQEYNVLTAWVPAVKRTWQTILFSLKSVKKMLVGDISYKQLSGPITIAKVASESAYSGIYTFLSLLALLSVSLGVLNLLPIPVLDGGHILFYLVEWIRGKPVSDKVQIFAYQIGLVVVMSIMVLAFINDIGRL